MAFAVSQVMKIGGARWEELFSLFEDKLVIRNWDTDAINYVHVHKLDMFGQNNESASNAGGAVAWVA